MALKWPWVRPGFKTDLAAVCAAWALFCCFQARSAEKWKMQYFYDKEASNLAFTDIKCPSARRCIASGILDEGKSDKGVVVVTADGGATWQLQDVKEHPVSLFFLNENAGWMVTDRGIWSTDEAGRTWKKIKDQKELIRVWFLDQNRGFAIGARKTAMETADGGRTWSPIQAAAKAPTAPEGTVYHWISFENAREGVIIGSWMAAMNPDALPDWMVPERARYRHQSPTVTILLQTDDGGKTWSEMSRSLDAALTKFLYAPTYALALFEYSNSAAVPSELVKMDLKTQKNSTVYKNPERAVRDFAILSDGEVMLAATERQGKSNVLPIPGKLKMMRSSSAMKTWLDMDVDYRAVATRVIMAAPDDKNVWAVTDTGMILKLTE